MHISRRIAVVTGGSAGIGLEIARELVQQGFHVVLAVRDVEKGERAAKEIGGAEVMRLDVADLDSVRAFATAFRRRHDRLHILVNNAGIHTAERRLSPQGVELTFATNHLGHFLLTNLLLDVLKASAPARVVNVASEAHRIGRDGDFTDVNEWGGFKAYAQSKLANILFTYALARRLEGTGVATNAAHPGSVRTGWARGRDSGAFRFVAALASPFLLSAAQGARTPLHLATSARLDGVSGRYYVRKKEAKSTVISRDVDVQERLWAQSARMAGLAHP